VRLADWNRCGLDNRWRNDFLFFGFFVVIEEKEIREVDVGNDLGEELAGLFRGQSGFCVGIQQS
jgi:hypothetical protein